MSKHNERFLQRSSVAISTIQRYDKALKHFKHYLRENNITCYSTQELDYHLAKYLNFGYNNKKFGFAFASNLLSSMKLNYPFISQYLHESRLCINGWRKLKRPKSKAPLSLELTNVISLTLAKDKEYGAALATLIGFHCLLRVSELCNILVSDVLLPPYNINKICIIRISSAKTGIEQSVQLFRQDIITMLTEYIKGVRESDRGKPLFLVTKSQYYFLFKRTINLLNLDSKIYSPHSLRHGGATHLYMNGMPINDILMRGRWAVHKSATIYIQMGRAIIIKNATNQKLIQLGNLIDQNIIMYWTYIFASDSSQIYCFDSTYIDQ
jgi:site-specific recombinase XerD